MKTEVMPDLSDDLLIEAGRAVAHHNSHLGDARATQMGTRGEWNVGQRVSQRYGRDVDRGPAAAAAGTGHRRDRSARDGAGQPRFPCVLSAQFDAVLHLDRTRAVEALERTAAWEAGEAPETLPSGMEGSGRARSITRRLDSGEDT